jgi:hypothetical protein
MSSIDNNSFIARMGQRCPLEVEGNNRQGKSTMSLISAIGDRSMGSHSLDLIDLDWP